MLVTGHRRGGTTWLGRLLSLTQESAYIFEPFTFSRHPETKHSRTLARFKDAPRDWIFPWPPGNENDAEYARAASGQIETLFDLYFQAAIGTLIVKLPGVEQLPFLQGVLQPETTVYIRRNPAAILNSYNKSHLYAGWNLKAEFQRCRETIARLRPDLLHMLSSIGDDSDLQIISMICVAHRLAQDWAIEGKLMLLEYEDLAVGGPGAAIELFERLGLRAAEDKSEELNRLFSPKEAQVGFLDTEKDSAHRARAYLEELAPWQLAKVRRYFERIGYADSVPPQNLRAQFLGSWEYGQREYRSVRNSAISRSSPARKWLAELGARGR